MKNSILGANSFYYQAGQLLIGTRGSYLFLPLEPGLKIHVVSCMEYISMGVAPFTEPWVQEV